MTFIWIICRYAKPVSGDSTARPGNVRTSSRFQSLNSHPTCFDVSVRSALHSGVLTHSAITPGFAALKREMEKDARHKEFVEAAG